MQTFAAFDALNEASQISVGHSGRGGAPDFGHGGSLQCTLQRLVVRARAAFGGRPVDDLVGILDVARLAMHAVRGIDLQALAALAVVDHFVDVGGTEACAGIAEFRCAFGGADRRISHLQVGGLIFVVGGRGEEHRRQAVARG